MNIGKTIEFILDQQAQTAADLQATNASLRRLTTRVDGITKLVKTGLTMLVRLERSTQEVKADAAARDKVTNLKINALIESQNKTERMLQAWLKNRPNGGGGNGN